MKKNKGFNLISVIIIICITSITSAITAGVIVTNNYDLSYSRLTSDENLQEFLQAYSNIVDNYYEDVDTSGMLDSALSAMLNYLGDNYTTHLDEQSTAALEEELKGESYEGIGITISGNEILKVATESPAATAGFLVGDKIIKVNEHEITDSNYTEIPTYLKEQEVATVIVDRNEESIALNVSVATIDTPNVDYKLLDNNIGYLQMTNFSATLSQQTTKALTYLENNNMTSLIIDLRDNPGGYLEQASEIASKFLTKGQIIYGLQDKNSTTQYKDETEEQRTYPIVILINGNTASASEILAAALKDNCNAVFVGETSYGKGKVQQTYELSNGSMAKFTSAKWLTPKGVCIDGEGLTPDYEVTNTIKQDEAGVEIGINDDQLAKAIEVISTM